MTTTNALSGQHVIVIGTGYAGLMCALQLAPAVRVTLVDPAGYFTERVALRHPGTAARIVGAS
jgi:NADH dehydrogenase